MTLAHQLRVVRVGLRIALVVLAVPLTITLGELVAGVGGARAWARFGAVAVAAAAILVVLRRQEDLMHAAEARQRAEDELRASEAKFSGILAIAADAIITVDEQQRILHFNRGAQEIFGYSEDEATGRSLGDLLPHRFRQAHAVHMQRFGDSSETARRMGERREIFALRRDGIEFPAEASISKLDLPGRRIFTVVLRDVTDRKRAEENERFLGEAGAQLVRSLEFDVVLDSVANLPVPRLADAVLVDVVGDDGNIRRAASKWAGEDLREPLQELANAGPLTWDSPSPVVDVLRRRRPELIEGIDAAWIEAHEDREHAARSWQATGVHAMLIVPLTIGERVLGAISLLMAAPGRSFTDEHRALADKFAVRASLALENARLYQTAQQATKARDEILGIVSHDLRNPLSAIAMCTRVLRHSPPADEDARADLLVTIGESTEWMNRLIQDLLDVANIERGQLSLEQVPEDVSMLISSATGMIERDAAQHGIGVGIELAEAVLPVLADSARVVQLLGNLLQNAVKFTADGGRITVSAHREDSRVVVAVRDTGAGIPPEVQDRIFDRYWHASRGARSRGSGLGLSIAKGIAEAHGGRLWVESAPGRGSTFYFSLPAARDADEQA